MLDFRSCWSSVRGGVIAVDPLKTLLFSMIVCVFLTKVTENLDGNITIKMRNRDQRSDHVDAKWQTSTGRQHVINV